MRRILTITVLAWLSLGWVSGLEACAVCFGAKGHPLTEGMNMGILCLLLVLLSVLGLFATFFIHLAQKASKV